MLHQFGLLFASLLPLLALGTETPTVPERLAASVRGVSMVGSDGKPYAPLAAGGQTATVLVFLMHDCPVTNATAPELARLAAEFAPRGVQFFGVYTTETAAEIEIHRRGYGLPFPGLLDPDLQLARAVGATHAPEAAVLSSSGELLYRGRIDDRAVKPGITRATPTRRDLRLAVQAVLAGQKPEAKFTKSIGCYLPMEQAAPTAAKTN